MPGRRHWLLAAALVLPGLAKADSGSVTPGLEGESFGSEDGGRIIVAHKARLATRDAQLSADEIRMNTADATIEARGNVIYTSENLRILGEHAEIDSRSGRIVAEKVRFGRKPAYFYADRFVMEKGNQTMEGVIVWYREPSAAGMSLAANEVRYTKADDRIVLTHIHPHIGGLPFFYVPRYAQRGYRDIPADVFLRVRTSSRQGAYLRTTTTIRQSPTTWTGLLLDAYSRAGWLIGPSLRYDNRNLPDGGVSWNSRIQGGWIDDRSDLSLYPDAFGRTIDSSRFFLVGSLNGRSPAGWEMAGSLQALSDPEVARDFRPQLSRETQLPRSFIEFTAPVAGGYASALVNVKTDNFQDVVQRLPELRLDLVDRPLGDSGWQGRLDLSAARMSERMSEQLAASEFLAATGLADRVALTRLDAYAGVSRPSSVGDWLTVKPVAGIRTTWWSDATDRDGSASRSVAQVGFDAEMLMTGTWGTQSSRWGIDGLRHTLRPFAQWRAMPAGGDDPSRVPRLDRLDLATVNAPVIDLADRPDTDTLTERQIAQVGVRNTLETRDAASGTRTLLRVDLFTDWRDERVPGGGSSSGVYAHAAWTPKDWLAIESLLKFDGSLTNHLGSATWLHLESGDLWKATLGLSDMSEGAPARQVFGSYVIRLNSAYSFNLTAWYDLINAKYIERSATLTQKIGNSWDLEYGLSERTSSRGNGSLGFSVRVRLFKF